MPVVEVKCSGPCAIFDVRQALVCVAHERQAALEANCYWCGIVDDLKVNMHRISGKRDQDSYVCDGCFESAPAGAFA